MADLQVPSEMRHFAERSVEQARKAFDSVMSATRGAFSTFEGQAAAAQTGAKDLQRKAVACAEHNVDASFEFAQRLLGAKSVEEVVQLHSDYVKEQMKTLGEQATELSKTAAKAGIPPKD